MFDKFLFLSVAALMAVALLTAPVSATTITHGSTTINMDFVPVGNPGNVGDATGSPYLCGAVSYNYNIGKYEVTENQWDAVVAADTNDLLNDPGYWSGDQPVTHISWNEAAMFCNWLTSGDVTDGAYAIDDSGRVIGIDRNRAVNAHGTAYVIPTEDEWYKAAYYDGSASTYYNYPTASNAVPDGIDILGDNAFDAVFMDGDNQGRPNDVDNAGVLSPYGTMGQGGNVWEWNETPINARRLLRGCFWGGSCAGVSATGRVSAVPTYEYYGVGFRVASVPEPGSIALFVCGLLSLICLRCRR